METLFAVLSTSIASIFAAILISIGIVLLIFLAFGILSDGHFTTASTLVGVLGFIFLVFQILLVFGAAKLKSYARDVERVTVSFSEGAGQSAPPAYNLSDLRKLRDEVSLLADWADLSDFSIDSLPGGVFGVLESIRSSLNRCIARHLCWTLVLTVLCAVCIALSLSRSRSVEDFIVEDYYDF